MFTGIIEEMGKVESIKKGSRSAFLTIETDGISEDLKVGDSIAVNGVCLTAAWVKDSRFGADVMNETLSRSVLGNLQGGSLVNLERAMMAGGRFGGHMVTGHIDGVGKVASVKKDGIALLYEIAAPSNIMRYIVEKGSIAIDGVSLTVAAVSRGSFCVSVIPHTAKETILFRKGAGSSVNLENDMIGKYVEKFVQDKGKITEEFLIQNGF
ncbi:riboflavin synthase alpha chain [Kineothrix alysoides]|uniref:Riboflavin synthase n=1 Tax=Kineothrix alysoides TaxID=1469948 RepID=A0A4R1QR52_9FIRM|nr:riboflavin synthase [Kineothrix alysoides]TCL55481.1 riboflavin synthase alpha chain [Kineothrix alysoides]